MKSYVYHKHPVRKRRSWLHVLSYGLLISGALVMFWAYYPIISFEIYARFFLQERTSSPIPPQESASAIQFARTVYAGNTIFSNNLRDFTSANVWFPSSIHGEGSTVTDLHEYELSIPKLNLFHLSVKAGGDDLSKSLIHYIPTSRPGQFGNVAIFGHSTIPQLFNPKDYKTVFTYLPQLDLGDMVQVVVNGSTYQYKVYDLFVVKPTQVSVLDQDFSGSYLTLITCVPPGTWEKRLIVKAKLVKNATP